MQQGLVPPYYTGDKSIPTAKKNNTRMLDFSVTRQKETENIDSGPRYPPPLTLQMARSVGE